jgi:glycosyltransferase involved in cell wall biosynthesis
MMQARGPNAVEDLPLITVVTAVRNQAKTLPACISSVAGQTYGLREHLVVDGGSTDGTVDILRASTDGPTWWTSAPDDGVYDAWNKALVRARGDWVCFLGADDFLWQPNVLERMAPHLAATEQGVKLVYGRLGLVDSAGHVRAVWGRPWEQERSRFLRGIMRLPHPGLFHRKALFDALGSFDESYRLAGDYELLLRELKQGSADHIADVIVAGMRLGGATHQLARRYESLGEVRRARKQHGMGGVSRQMAWAYAKTFALTCSEALLGTRLVGRLKERLRPAPSLELDEHYTVW